MNGEHKITGGHRARTALVYLRQSTLVQLREHTESTLRQYALADTAVALGWAPQDAASCAPRYRSGWSTTTTAWS